MENRRTRCERNGVNNSSSSARRVSPGRDSVLGQALPGRHPATAHGESDVVEQASGRRKGATVQGNSNGTHTDGNELGNGKKGARGVKRRKWSRTDNVTALECYFQSQPEQRGYRQRMHDLWEERAMFEVSEQRLSDQIRTILRKNWFTSIELACIKGTVAPPQPISGSDTDEPSTDLLASTLTQSTQDLVESQHSPTAAEPDFGTDSSDDAPNQSDGGTSEASLSQEEQAALSRL